MSYHRSTLRVRHPDSGVVYHLVFDGSLRKLTGMQLMQHLERICLIPVEQQHLTCNGAIVLPTSTGDELGLRDKILLELHVVPNNPPHYHNDDHHQSNNNNNSSNNSIHRKQQQQQYSRSNTGGYSTQNTRLRAEHTHQSKPHIYAVEAPLNQSDRHVFPRSEEPIVSKLVEPSPPRPLEQEGPREISFSRALRSVDISRLGAVNKNNNNGNSNSNALNTIPSCAQDPVEAFINEDAMEDIDEAMMPVFDADIMDARLEQKEYMWMMEQMRFETERMNREREILLQRQNLEYEAEILERERCILGRRTLQERRKLLELQQWIREEMLVESRLLDFREESGYSEPCNPQEYKLNHLAC